MFKQAIFLLLMLISGSSLSADLSSENCPFCDPKVLQLQAFYEDELVLALCTHRPVFPGHCLVIPKRHVERFEELSEAEADRIFLVLKKVNVAASSVFLTSSYLLLQKNGWESGQSVPHVHFHYIPRREGDGSALSFFLHMIWANLGSPISLEETQKTAAEMRQAMD